MTIKNSPRQILLPLLMAAILIGGIWLGRVLTLRSVPQGTERLLIYPQTNKLDALLNLIEEEYVDTVKKDELVEAIIPELLKNLDPHTVYIPASELQEVNEELEGNFGGIGVQFSLNNDTVLVISVIPGGPSEKLGILPGDRIISVDDSVFVGSKVTNNIVMKKLRGPMGTKVKVGIARRSMTKPLEFTITRGAIPVTSVDASFMIDDKTGYIKVSRFAKNTYEEFITALAKLKSSNCREVIVDLRGNSGGFLDVAFNMINEFLKKDEMIVYTEGKASSRQTMTANGTGSCQDTRVKVLIDEFSASASEIFAGAIQDNDRGIIYGRRSFGKGLVQQQIPLPDGSAIRLTIARYYTPSGRCIQKPYENGSDDYYQDIMKRFEHGEFYEKDSIRFSDTITYKTKGGRNVYGGGGVMPDVFVARDTLNYTEYYYRLREKGLLYQFALEYADRHRDRLSRLKTAAEFEQVLSAANITAELVKYAEKSGLTPNPAQFNKSKRLIDTELMAYVARNIIDNEGFYMLMMRTDEILLEALKTQDGVE